MYPRRQLGGTVALEFVEELPKATRGGGGRSHKYMTEDAVGELKDNPGKWARVAKGVTSAQSVAQWVNKAENKDSFEYASRATGKKVKNTKNEDVPAYDVFVRYNPEGKKS